MECRKLGLNSKQRGCTGFDNIVTSVKTVYEAASQEGWVYLMYNTTDAYPAWERVTHIVTNYYTMSRLVTAYPTWSLGFTHYSTSALKGHQIFPKKTICPV